MGTINGTSDNDSLNGTDTGDTIYGLSGNDILYGNAGDDTLYGGAGVDRLYAGEGNDLLYGGTGNDILDGEGGADTMSGGAGDDSYTVENTGDTVTESLDGGYDSIYINDTDIRSWVMSANVEELGAGTNGFTVVGNASDNVVSLDGGDDLVYGMAGKDLVYGSDGNDTLFGGAGDDILDGWSGDDMLYGGSGNDKLLIGQGGGHVDGGSGVDIAYINALPDDCNVDTTPGAMSIDISGDVNTLRNVEILIFSNGESQVLISSSSATSGNDFLYVAGDGGFALNGLAGNDILLGLGGGDTLAGGGDDDTLRGGQGDDTLNGGSGNDMLYGEGGADAMAGGSGNDTYVIDAADASVTEDANGGIDTVVANFDGYVLAANVENLTLDAVTQDGSDAGTWVDASGNELANVIVGSLSANRLLGLGGSDTLSGSFFNDVLDGGTGADQMTGGTGNDTYWVDNAGDKVYENAGEGVDTVQATASSYTLAANLEKLIYQGSSNFTGSGNALDNQINGGTGNDSLYGGAGNDTLTGGTGDDTLNGGTGTDTAVFAGNRADYDVTRTGETKFTISGGGHTATLIDVEVLKFDDTQGAPSDFTLNQSSDWSDFFVQNGTVEMAGDKGNDTYTVTASNAVISELPDSGTDTVLASVSVLSLWSNVENLTLTGSGNADGYGNAHANVITGNNSDNILKGDDGNDTLYGLGESDMLEGGDGNDTLYGGDDADALYGEAGSDKLIGGGGDDNYYVGSGDEVTEAADEGNDLVLTDLLSYTLGANLERLQFIGSGNFTGSGNALDNMIFGGDGNDTLKGGAGDDTLDGGSGNDIIDGGAGDDTVSLAADINFLAISRIGANKVTVYNTHTEQALTLTGVETLDAEGGNVDLTISGFFLNNRTDWNDWFDASSPMDGGKGNDTYVINASDDSVVEAADAGIDTVQASISVDSLWDNVENLTLTGIGDLTAKGNAIANVITGNSGNNFLEGLGGKDTLYGLGGNDTLYGGGGSDTLDGGVGDDLLDGGAGGDSMSGGDGNDMYFVDNVDDKVIELADEGTDTVLTTLSSYSLSANVESLNFQGTGNFTGTGNNLDNQIQGGSGNDTLNGGAGNDWLIDGGGNDSLNGGAGTDYAVFVGARDDYTFARASNTTVKVTHTVGGVANTETLSGIEGVDFMNSGSPVLIDVEDLLLNQSSNWNDFFEQNGTVEMAGGKGNDTYTVTASNAVISELADDGIDSVVSSANIAALAANVENLTLTGSGLLYGYGNNLANTITANNAGNELRGQGGNDRLYGGAGADMLDGGAGNDVLSGGAGNDLLSGGSGSDAMTGGAGDDTYMVDSTGDTVTETFGNGIDEVKTDLSIYTLGANVENLTSLGSAAFNGTGNALDNVIVGGLGKDTLNGSSGDDELQGKEGNDKLIGGSGQDLLDGGSGNDTLNGGAGVDVLTGGDGNDVFVFNAAANSAAYDEITDFLSGTDSIWLENDVFVELTQTGALSGSLFESGDFATKTATRIIYDDSGNLWYDADGSGNGDAVLVARILGAPTLTAADIKII